MTLQQQLDHLDSRITDLYHQSTQVSAIGESFEGECQQIEQGLTAAYQAQHDLLVSSNQWDAVPF